MLRSLAVSFCEVTAGQKLLQAVSKPPHYALGLGGAGRRPDFNQSIVPVRCDPAERIAIHRYTSNRREWQVSGNEYFAARRRFLQQAHSDVN
ncbi:hypothetical protein D9M68_708370 [compost metagenome]